MFCAKCGTELLDDALFCAKCGTRRIDAPKEDAEAEDISTREKTTSPKEEPVAQVNDGQDTSNASKGISSPHCAPARENPPSSSDSSGSNNTGGSSEKSRPSRKVMLAIIALFAIIVLIGAGILGIRIANEKNVTGKIQQFCYTHAKNNIIVDIEQTYQNDFGVNVAVKGFDSPDSFTVTQDSEDENLYSANYESYVTNTETDEEYNVAVQYTVEVNFFRTQCSLVAAPTVTPETPSQSTGNNYEQYEEQQSSSYSPGKEEEYLSVLDGWWISEYETTVIHVYREGNTLCVDQYDEYGEFFDEYVSNGQIYQDATCLGVGIEPTTYSPLGAYELEYNYSDNGKKLYFNYLSSGSKIPETYYYLENGWYI